MEYLPQVMVSKEDLLALSDLAGEMSIMDYMSKVIHEHVAAQHRVHWTAFGVGLIGFILGSGVTAVYFVLAVIGGK